MIGFLSLPSHRMLPLSRIKLIGKQQKREGRMLATCTIDLFDSASIEVEAYEVDLLLKRPVQLLPAEAGIQLLAFDVRDVENPFVGRTPLIAWALCVDGETRPVTPAGVDDGGDEPNDGWYVEMPDKRVFCTNAFSGIGVFDNAGQALAHFLDHRPSDDGVAE